MEQVLQNTSVETETDYAPQAYSDNPYFSCDILIITLKILTMSMFYCLIKTLTFLYSSGSAE